MSFNLIDSAKSLFSSEMLGKASAYLGESESAVAKAVGGILPTLLGGLVNKASDNDGATAVAQMAQEAHSSGIAANLQNFAGDDGGGLLSKGAGLLSGLFGNKLDGLSGLISNFAGVKSSSVSSLMSMAAPAVLGMIGKHASENNLGASDISSLLSSQKDNIAAAMPADLNLSSVLGNVGGNVSNVAKTTTAPASSHASEVVEKSGGAGRYLLPVVLLALLAMAAFYLFGKGCNKEAGTTTHEEGTHDSAKTEEVAGEMKSDAVAVGTLDTLTGNFNYNLGKMITIDLPNGAGKLEVGENSTENKLYKFLSDPNATLDTVKGNWFEFTNVRFKTGGSEILDESKVQLNNMVAISKAFPTAQFKLGGYTDNTGSSAGNIVLSQKRADAVAAMLTKLGANAKSIAGAKGYGPEWPVADNATPEGRAQNRRVAVNVKAK
jgi:outer membrane protein OmpA-like peptidoglycan-associated protein